MKANEVAEKAIHKINSRITDLVFLEVQNDRELMQSYLRCVENDGLDKTNQQIGKAVKLSYKLSNLEDREIEPMSTLIQSHQIFQ